MTERNTQEQGEQSHARGERIVANACPGPRAGLQCGQEPLWPYLGMDGIDKASVGGEEGLGAREQ